VLVLTSGTRPRLNWKLEMVHLTRQLAHKILENGVVAVHKAEITKLSLGSIAAPSRQQIMILRNRFTIAAHQNNRARNGVDQSRCKQAPNQVID
jgi:hypothetical protein